MAVVIVVGLVELDAVVYCDAFFSGFTAELCCALFGEEAAEEGGVEAEGA